MIRFFGQPKYSITQNALGYELFIRQSAKGNWIFPKNFSQFTAQQLKKLSIASIKALPKGVALVSINLDQEQFINPDFIHSMKAVQAACYPVEVVIELTEHHRHIAPNMLVSAAQKYQAANLWVCLDDVGTGDNTVAMANLLDPYVTEYKFALQNFKRGANFSFVISPQLQFWRQFAQIHHKFFAIEGFETEADLTIGDHYQADVMQGYYLGRPKLITLGNDAI
ncbi:EAL domain-containing protein [Loigolactobacillus binensis]|uniref:EAL domain-containing protein n=1 Tax=Loigolactobacillus binensis TaxID=2559922 RepID=A0ABW3EED6_9LACO|nr:EAL domain-containing protein [Loigolactobacillus binensis]